jgi:branched-chain amino acid transport system ATP-binding protein
MSMPIISVTDIHTYYGDSYILQGVSLSANPGEVVTILGRNGVGKSTLAKTIIGFLPARRGAICLSSQDVTAKSPEARSRAGIALVPQGRRTFRSLTVAETLDMASHLRRFDRNNLSWTVDEIYSVFPRLAERRDNRAGTLSGGEQQMLAVGRALVGNPRVVVLDEPTEGLSPLLVKELQEVLRMVKADRVVVINKGTVVFESSPAELERADHIKHRYLGV